MDDFKSALTLLLVIILLASVAGWMIYHTDQPILTKAVLLVAGPIVRYKPEFQGELPIRGYVRLVVLFIVGFGGFSVYLWLRGDAFMSAYIAGQGIGLLLWGTVIWRRTRAAGVVAEDAEAYPEEESESRA